MSTLTNLTSLYTQWGDRVAFNEGYARQRIKEARSAGAEAFSAGLNRNSARTDFLAGKQDDPLHDPYSEENYVADKDDYLGRPLDENDEDNYVQNADLENFDEDLYEDYEIGGLYEYLDDRNDL